MTSWSNVERVLLDGRTLFARLPECSPADSDVCVEFLGRPRPLVFFLHGSFGAEDPTTASYWLNSYHRLSPDTIFVFGVSAGASRLWDAGLCCTSAPVDDVGYLGAVVEDLAGQRSLDRRRVGGQ